MSEVVVEAGLGNESKRGLHQRARGALDQLRRELLDGRSSDGHWTGRLSASALSTATAVSAIAATIVHGQEPPSPAFVLQVSKGMDFLRTQQNVDGGFGDTDRSLSNIATSYLVLAASALAKTAGCEPLDRQSKDRLDDYIRKGGGIEGLRRRYGTDKTFVVPIMTNMAIAGLIDWDDVASLPFEAAVFPQSMYRFLQMPVVSYAIPALVAIGQTRHFLGRRTFLPWRWVRAAAVRPTMKVLGKMQPESGGYLEATPLTSFVVMSLAVTGRGDHEVSRRGLKFLADSMLDDGSWPIDTNLATWVTSLAIDALASDPEDDGEWYSDGLLDWHLSCQHLTRHPFTGAEPGGWGWTDLSGAVPDSDDTPGAILALAHARKRVTDSDSIRAINQAIDRGQRWLLKLQNRNGGWPTFCRGWGKLPFDRSSTDLTGHAIRALLVETDFQIHSETAIKRGAKFLSKSQQINGAWLPLWFGNQDRPDEDNPIYGTSKVLMAATSDGGRTGLSQASVDRAVQFLIESQNLDGGWGGGKSITTYWAHRGSDDDKTVISSFEETALAVDALASASIAERRLLSSAGNDGNGAFAGGNARLDQAIIGGVEFLLSSIDGQRHQVPWPIGFYFAKLWYYERLYPPIFAAAALGKALRSDVLRKDPPPDTSSDPVSPDSVSPDP
ncbi:MAG: prenyltransferase/squalene oxidase repeat-containing protein [Rubripirellula sp.]